MSAYYKLFEHMKNDHKLTLTDSEMEEICRIVGGMDRDKDPTMDKEFEENIIANGIFDWMVRNCEFSCSTEEFKYLAKNILSLLPDYRTQPNPWGLAVQNTCPGESLGGKHLMSCLCRGTGFTPRLLTVDEVGELLKDTIQSGLPNIQMDYKIKKRFLLLPIGELVVVLPMEKSYRCDACNKIWNADHNDMKGNRCPYCDQPGKVLPEKE
jgi:hypothetical protein